VALKSGENRKFHMAGERSLELLLHRWYNERGLVRTATRHNENSFIFIFILSLELFASPNDTSENGRYKY